MSKNPSSTNSHSIQQNSQSNSPDTYNHELDFNSTKPSSTSSSELNTSRFRRSSAPTPQIPSQNTPDFISTASLDSLSPIPTYSDDKIKHEPSIPTDSHDIQSNSIPTDQQIVSQTAIFMNTANEHELLSKQITENANKMYSIFSLISSLYDLKIHEIELEKELICEGKHPDYIKTISDLTERKEADILIAQQQYIFSIQNYKKTCEAEFKLAKDTFNERRRVLKKHIRERLNRLIFQLRSDNAFLEKSSSLNVPILSCLNDSALTVGKRKRLLFDQLSLGPGYTDKIPMPDWIRHVLKLRRRAGLDPVPVPSPCGGLDDTEVEEDLAFIKDLQDICPDEPSKDYSSETKPKSTLLADTDISVEEYINDTYLETDYFEGVNT